MAPKVRDAAIATTMGLGHQNRAVKLLEEHAAINALGVLTYPCSHRTALLEAAAQITAAAQSDRERLRQGVRPTNERPKAVTITDRIPLPVQLATIERMLARAKTETDWPAISALKATAELI